MSENESTSQPPPPDISPEGVDRSLIRWLRSLTIDERLQYAQDHANAILQMREELEDPE